MSAVLRAKFYVSEVRQIGGYANTKGVIIAERVKLEAVYAEDGPNAEWAKYTPSGQLEMQVDNPDALGILKPGQEYYLDFTPAE